MLPAKFKKGDVSDCEIVAFVESTALGDDRGNDVVVTKSPEDKRLVLVIHPRGRRGIEVESNRSTYAGWANCAWAQHMARTNERRRVFMKVARAVSGRSDFPLHLVPTLCVGTAYFKCEGKSPAVFRIRPRPP